VQFEPDLIDVLSSFLLDQDSVKIRLFKHFSLVMPFLSEFALKNIFELLVLQY